MRYYVLAGAVLVGAAGAAAEFHCARSSPGQAALVQGLTGAMAGATGAALGHWVARFLKRR